MAFYSQEELQQLGFKSLGSNVLISDKASIYGANRIEVGDHSRIDDFCVLSAGEGGIKIGCNVHVSVYCSLIGKAKIVLDDYSGISSKVAVYSSNDDYSGRFMTNPTVPVKYTNVACKAVRVGRHVVVGSGSVILPGSNLNDGCAVGSLSLVAKDCDAGYIYAGNPAKKLKKRSDKLFELEKSLISSTLTNNL